MRIAYIAAGAAGMYCGSCLHDNTLAAALLATLRGLGRGFTSRVALATGVVLVAIAVHSLFYAAFFEDPMTWALLGLVGLTARVPRKPGPAPARLPFASDDPPVAEPAPTPTA